MQHYFGSRGSIKPYYKYNNNGRRGGIRTRKPVRAADFKSAVYTIPPPARVMIGIIIVALLVFVSPAKLALDVAKSHIYCYSIASVSVQLIQLQQTVPYLHTTP